MAGNLVGVCLEAIQPMYYSAQFACSGILQEADNADAESIVQLAELEDSLETPYVPPCTKLIEEYMQHRFRLST